jgi:hypothetical protein
MKNYMVVVIVITFLTLISCKKDYRALTGDVTLAGYAYLADTNSNLPPSPLAAQKIYLNKGTDTSSYIFQGVTDSIGQFSMHSLDEETEYVVFSRFVKNNTEYAGAIYFKGMDIRSKRVVLNVYPVYRNGMSLLFTDVPGGYIPNLPFRLYTSRVMAVSDSITYAFASATSSPTGQYNRYDIPATEYYVVSKLSVGGLNLAIFDSITVDVNAVKQGTMVLK